MTWDAMLVSLIVFLAASYLVLRQLKGAGGCAGCDSSCKHKASGMGCKKISTEFWPKTETDTR